MPKALICNVDTILVDKGDHSVRFNRGEELVDIPGGSLDSMVRLGQAVSAEEFTAPVTVAASTPVIEQPKPWTATSVDELELPKSVKAALAKAGFSTVADVLAHGSQFGSLLSLDGMTEAKEEAVQKAILKVKPLESE